MKFASGIFASLVAASSVAAHATFQDLWAAGVDKVATCVMKPANNNPVQMVSDKSVACNTYSPSPGKCEVTAGTVVQVEMHQQPGDRTCSNEAIGGNHDGSTIIYMAKVDDALSANPNSAKWFKVAETGLVSKDYWGTDVMNANCGKVPFTVPACLAPGDYLIRAEVIALHVAGSLNGAQLYMSCFTVTVTSSGSTLPSNTVSFPGAYVNTDPGIKFDLYGQYTSYPIPGPAVFTCGGSPATSVGPVTSVKPGSTSSTKPVSTSSTKPATTSSAAAGGAPLYGQCGGIGWSGATTCASGKCFHQSDYYWQCIP